jgi:hypothetical protein
VTYATLHKATRVTYATDTITVTVFGTAKPCSHKGAKGSRGNRNKTITCQILIKKLATLHEAAHPVIRVGPTSRLTDAFVPASVRFFCTGNGACTAIPDNCGTGPGTPCCPMPYHVDSNPKLQRYGCLNNQFCNYGNSTTGALPSGTCEPNPSDCGQFGKKCCIFTGGAATGMRCGAQSGQSGPKGYCANPVGYKGANQAPLKDLVCTQCPDSVDPGLEKSNPNLYFACKTWS